MTSLLVHAAAREGESLVGLEVRPGGPGAALLELGVGKIAATLTLTHALAQAQADARRPELVLAFGLAGAYPARHLRAGLVGLDLLDVCVVSHEWLADEGVERAEGFVDLAAMGGLGTIGPWPCDPELSDRLAELLDCPRVIGATVSTVSGVDRLSQGYAARTGAQIETMEGAALAAVCQRMGVRFAELRVISNYTGERARSGWDLEGSLARLAAVMDRVLASGLLP